MRVWPVAATVPVPARRSSVVNGAFIVGDVGLVHAIAASAMAAKRARAATRGTRATDSLMRSPRTGQLTVDHSRRPSGLPGRDYWMGAAGGPNGSVGAAGPVMAQTTLAWLVANDRVPVVPKVI